MMRLLRRILYLARQGRHTRDLDEEMAFHREMLTRRSLGEDGAGSRAMGNVTLAREDARAVWMGRWIEEGWQDARYAVRSMSRQPAFALAAIVIVALGAGAATCVFGLLDALVLRSLPVERPDRLVWFRSPAFSYPIYREVKTRMTVFDGVFGWNVDRTHIDWMGRQGELQPADVLEVTGEFFPTLRVRPAIGRTFGEGDTAVAVITHAAWKRHFGSDPTAVGRTILVGDITFTIVGVAPPGFFGVAPGLEPEVIVPVDGRYGAGDSVFTSTTSSWLHLMARLKDGVSHEQAQAALQVAWPGVLEATTNKGMPADRRALYLSRATSLASARTGFSRVRNQFGDPLWLLMVLVGLLLAVACASVADLLLARGVARRKEIAVRLAIGAGRGRIFRQLVTESIVLTTAGVSLGLLIASWAGNILVGFIQTTRDRTVLDTTPGWRTLGFAVLVAAVVSLLASLLPAVQAARRDVNRALKDTGDGIGGRRRWSAGKALVAVQIALAVVLLAGAAVFGRSLARVLSQDTGLDAANVIVVSANAAAAGYKDEGQRTFHQQILERLRRLPGVESAALSWMPPISNNQGNWTQSIAIDGGALLRDAPYVYFNGISPRYFDTVGMQLRRGRDLADTDTASSPRVVIVNESLARQFFPGQDPIGRRISIGRAAARKDLEIVGIVQDAKYRTLQEPPRHIAYLSIAQIEDVTSGRDPFAEVRTADLSATAIAARQIVRTLDGRVPVRIETIADRIRESTITERLIAMLATALGGTALVLACAGLYGMLAYGVSRRRREIGLRIALGAERASVLWLVQRESIGLALAGVAVGLAAAVALARFVAATLLFQISATDPLALGLAAAIMLAVAVAAAYVPARRAASVDPVVALKTEA
jgi:predicted permease